MPVLTLTWTVKQTQTDETLGHPADHPDQCENHVFSDLICLANTHLLSPINNTEQHVFMTLLLLTQFICSSSELKHPLALFLFFSSSQWPCLCHSLFIISFSSTYIYTPLTISVFCSLTCIATLKLALQYTVAYGSRELGGKCYFMSRSASKNLQHNHCSRREAK